MLTYLVCISLTTHLEWYRLPKMKNIPNPLQLPDVYCRSPPQYLSPQYDEDSSYRPMQSVKVQKLRFVRGTKGNPKMLLGNYAYFKNNCNTDRTYWLCSRNRKFKCTARIITKASTCEVMLKNQVHNHGPEYYYDHSDEDEVISFNVVDSV